MNYSQLLEEFNVEELDQRLEMCWINCGYIDPDPLPPINPDAFLDPHNYNTNP